MEELLRNPPEIPMSRPNGTSLWLKGRHLNDACAEVLAHLLQRGDYKHLTCLELGKNHITAQGMCAIAGAIAQGALPALDRISLDENPIFDEGMVALCAVMQHMPMLNTLELTNCRFGDVGFLAFAAAGKAGHAKNVMAMYLRGNQIADAGFTAFCDVFANPKSFPKMEVLHFHDNQIGDEGFLAFSEAVESGHVDHVRLWHMNGNKLTKDSHEVVTEALKEYEKDRMITVYF